MSFAALILFVILAAAVGFGGIGVFLLSKARSVQSGGSSDQLLHTMREELDAVSMRLMRVEEDLSFLDELHAPEDKGRLGRPRGLSGGATDPDDKGV